MRRIQGFLMTASPFWFKCATCGERVNRAGMKTHNHSESRATPTTRLTSETQSKPTDTAAASGPAATPHHARIALNQAHAMTPEARKAYEAQAATSPILEPEGTWQQEADYFAAMQDQIQSAHPELNPLIEGGGSAPVCLSLQIGNRAKYPALYEGWRVWFGSANETWGGSIIDAEGDPVPTADLETNLPIYGTSAATLAAKIVELIKAHPYNADDNTPPGHVPPAAFTYAAPQVFYVRKIVVSEYDVKVTATTPERARRMVEDNDHADAELITDYAQDADKWRVTPEAEYLNQFKA